MVGARSWKDARSSGNAVEALMSIRLRRGLRLGTRGFGLLRFGFLGSPASAGACAIVRFGPGLVALAAVIRDIKAGALENQPRSRSKQPFHRPLAPGPLGAGVLRARRQSSVLHGLKDLEGLAAFGALIFVCRHYCGNERVATSSRPGAG